MNQEYGRIKAVQENICSRLTNQQWKIKIDDLSRIPQGDMPLDRIKIDKSLVERAELLLPQIVKQLLPIISENPYQRAVLTVYGGSGVGKTSIASLLSCYFNQVGVGSYTLSGDNYPHRIPKYNDAERLRIFRENGIRRMIADGVYTREHFAMVHKWQKMEEDANPAYCKEYPWFASYLDGGRKGLEGYLGTREEIAFDDVTDIVSAFKDGAEAIWLKRMGREEAEVWYDCIDFEKIHILIIEWTHGNSDYYHGVDIPILLNSTPQETLEYRKARNRDDKTDSAFTAMVLEIEQNLLRQQASKAKIILSQSGELLTYEAYCKLMEESGEKVYE